MIIVRNGGRAKAVGALVAFSATTLIAGLVASPAAASPATARPAHLTVKKTVATGYVGPLQFAVSGKNIYVADSFTANLYKAGVSAPLVHNPDPAGASEEATADIAGVGVDPRTGVVAFTETNADHSYTRLSLYSHGKTTVLANLAAYEAKHNPDGKVHYGVDNPSKCVTDAFAAAGIPASYTGGVDSHPYAVVALGNGAWAVADAGGNDIVKVDRFGHVSTIAVLPVAAVKITAAIAAANHLPACVVGKTYKFEPVPTDVENGPFGTLLVSTLASGPDGDPSPVATGSVYAIGFGGRMVRLATGFANATNLAYDGCGNVYVAELGAGQITKLSIGHRSVVATLPGVVGVEFANGHLYASLAPAVIGGAGPGSVVLLG